RAARGVGAAARGSWACGCRGHDCGPAPPPHAQNPPRTPPRAAPPPDAAAPVRPAALTPLPARLRLVAVEPAGSVVTETVTPGTAVKLFTGSVIPDGADTVVRIEVTEEEENSVIVREAPAAGANIRDAGEDIRPGQVVVRAGTILGPAGLGGLASAGPSSVAVHRRPRVAIVSTGSELVEVDETPKRGQ